MLISLRNNFILQVWKSNKNNNINSQTNTSGHYNGMITVTEKCEKVQSVFFGQINI